MIPKNPRVHPEDFFENAEAGRLLAAFSSDGSDLEIFFVNRSANHQASPRITVVVATAATAGQGVYVSSKWIRVSPLLSQRE